MKYKKARLPLLAVLCISLVLSLVSCGGKPPAIEEVQERLEYLIESSFEINEVLFGKGLPINEGGGELYGEVNGYEYVSDDAKYRTVNQIKEAAEKVYSADYLRYVYETAFTGVADSSVGIVTARFIEENGELLQEAELESLIHGNRKYDYSTMKIVRPSNASTINIELTSWIENGALDSSEGFSDEYIAIMNGKKHSVRLTFIKQDGEWYLDTPTY